MSAILSRAEVVERLDEIRPDILALGVRRLALFGSTGRKEHRPGSDIDLLVEFGPGEKTYTRFLDLADLLEQALEARVDLVTVEGLSPHIGPHILAEAADVLRAA